MKAPPARPITNFPAKANVCVNSLAIKPALNLSIADYEKSLHIFKQMLPFEQRKASVFYRLLNGVFDICLAYTW